MMDAQQALHDKQKSKIVSVKEWACRPLQEKYRLSRQIGQGAYGSVYEAFGIDDSKIKFALKKMENFQQKQDKEGKPFGFPITTLRQIKLLQHLEHQNILNIRDVVFQRPHRYSHKSPTIYLCLDLMDTDLGFLVRDKQYQFSPYKIQKITKQILEGLAYLHSKNVAHRDLKPANILLNKQQVIKVADFGLAKKLAKFSTTLVVTMWYRAPQLFFGLKNYTTNIDIWSLGCVLAQFMIKAPLFGHCRAEKQQLQAIYDLVGTPDTCEWEQVEKLQNYELYKPKVSKQSNLISYLRKKAPEFDQEHLLLDLIQKMLRLNPHSRYSAAECLNHEFFKQQYEEEVLLPQSIIDKKQLMDQGQDHISKRQKFN